MHGYTSLYVYILIFPLSTVVDNREERTFPSGLSFVQILTRMRSTILQQQSNNTKSSNTQIPQLSSNRPVDLRQDFYLVPPDCVGIRRAILIGIDYHNPNDDIENGSQQQQQQSCHKDCLQMKKYLINVWGFQEENIIMLLNDGQHVTPTKHHILTSLQQIATTSQPGDAVCTYTN